MRAWSRETLRRRDRVGVCGAARRDAIGVLDNARPSSADASADARAEYP